MSSSPKPDAEFNYFQAEYEQIDKDYGMGGVFKHIAAAVALASALMLFSLYMNGHLG